MNKNNFFSEITREYSFLDDFELNFDQQNQSKPTTSNTNREINTNKKYLNNYPEYNNPQPELNQPQNHIELEKEKFKHTKYGEFVNRSLDSNKLNDLNYLYENLGVRRGVNSSSEIEEQSDQEILEEALEVVKKKEYKFYAYLNKEFNTLNMKRIRCNLICYDKPELFTVHEAKLCAEACGHTIQGAQKFVENIQEEKKIKLLNCLENAKIFHNNPTSEDKVRMFIDCYENLLSDFDEMENSIRNEFSNYI